MCTSCLTLSHISVFPFTVQVSSTRSLDHRAESVHVKKWEKHSRYNSKKQPLGPVRHSSRIKQVRKVNYSELEVVESDSESEFVANSESGFGSINGEPYQKEEVQLDIEEETWNPRTLSSKASKVRLQFVRMAEENKQLHMAKQSETSSVDRLMEMMLNMRMEDQKRKYGVEQEREQRLAKEKREQIEREEQREERRIEREERRQREDRELQTKLITTLKEAHSAVPQRVTINSTRFPL